MQEYPVNDDVSLGSILGLALFPLKFDSLSDDVIAIYVDTTLYPKCYQGSGLRQQLELVLKWVANFNAGKTELVLFEWFDNSGAINVKIDGSFLEKKSHFKIMALPLSSKLDKDPCIVSISETVPKKMGALNCSLKCLSTEVVLFL